MRVSLMTCILSNRSDWGPARGELERSYCEMRVTDCPVFHRGHKNQRSQAQPRHSDGAHDGMVDGVQKDVIQPRLRGSGVKC